MDSIFIRIAYKLLSITKAFKEVSLPRSLDLISKVSPNIHTVCIWEILKDTTMQFFCEVKNRRYTRNKNPTKCFIKLPLMSLIWYHLLFEDLIRIQINPNFENNNLIERVHINKPSLSHLLNFFPRFIISKHSHTQEKKKKKKFHPRNRTILVRLQRKREANATSHNLKPICDFMSYSKFIFPPRTQKQKHHKSVSYFLILSNPIPPFGSWENGGKERQIKKNPNPNL